MSVLEDAERLLESEMASESLWELERLKPVLLRLRVEKQKVLFKTLEQYRHPKDKELTDFDRRTMLDAQVAEVRADYELAAGLEQLVKERCALWLSTIEKH